MTARPATREERHLTLLWTCAAASALVLRPLWLAVAPLLRPCTFRALTGLPCPSCGTTRAATALLDGDLASSLAANPLAGVIGLGFIVGAIVAPLWAYSGLAIPRGSGSLQPRHRVAVGFVFCLNWLDVILAHS